LRAWTTLLLLACAGDSEVKAPDDVEETDALVADPTVEVHIQPDVAWGDAPLQCVSTRADAALQWLVDGVPWEGALTTQLPGDTVPAEALVAGQTWTCVAAANGLAVDHVSVRPPNVIVLLADDLGYGDLSSYGGPTPTPQLDTLAAQGVRFTEAYAAAPVCGPSRAGLLTGRQPSRYGFEYNVLDDPSGVARGLPIAERTLADHLRLQRYSTALFGKWHLGFGPTFHPNLRGFDHFFGFLNGRRPSLEPGLVEGLELEVSEAEIAAWPASTGGWLVEENGIPATLDERHLTDRLADEAISWIRTQRDAPFFALISFNAVHIPLQATTEQLSRVEPHEDPSTWAYRATLAGLDDAVGRILTALEDEDLADHTLIVFTSDNGCPAAEGFCSNGPLAGGKIMLTEGGLRVPLLLRWTDRVAPGQVRSDMVSQLDVLPTAVAAAGGALNEEAIDGVDLLPWLINPAHPPPHEVLYWRMLPVRAIRRGADKLVDTTANTWRFDLQADPGEQQDIHPTDPARSRELADELDDRARLYVPPSWIGQPAVTNYYGDAQGVLF
jgi:arylsulfatase A-like enzyme